MNDHIKFMRKPDGSWLYTTRATLKKFGYETVLKLAKEQIREQHTPGVPVPAPQEDGQQAPMDSSLHHHKGEG